MKHVNDGLDMTGIRQEMMMSNVPRYTSEQAGGVLDTCLLAGLLNLFLQP
jgi:hypothetical protein